MTEETSVRYEEMHDPRINREVHRAVIRFAPGPHGEVFTDWYMGQGGADTVVEKLRTRLAGEKAEKPQSEEPAPYRERVKVGDTVRLPDGHFATVAEVGITADDLFGEPTAFVEIMPEGNWRTRLWYRIANQLRWYEEDIDRLTYVSPEELKEIDERLDIF